MAANKLHQVLMQKRLGQKRYRVLALTPVYVALARGLTFTWFAFTLLWFWSTWSQIGGFVQVAGPAASVVAWLAIFIAATLTLATIEAARASVLRLTWHDGPLVYSRYVRTAWGTALAVVTAAIIVLLASPAPDIVYKAF